MYRIMIAQAKRDNYETLYKYLTTNIDGEVIPLELFYPKKLWIKELKRCSMKRGMLKATSLS